MRTAGAAIGAIVACALVVAFAAPAAAVSLSAEVVALADGARRDTLTFSRIRPADTWIVSPECIRITPNGDGGIWQIFIHTENAAGGRGMREASRPESGVDLFWQVHAERPAAFGLTAGDSWGLLHDPIEAEWDTWYRSGILNVATGCDSLAELGEYPSPARTAAAPFYVPVATDISHAAPGDYVTSIQVDLLVLGAMPTGAALVTCGGGTLGPGDALVWQPGHDNGTGLAGYILEIDTTGRFRSGELVWSQAIEVGETGIVLPPLAAGTYCWRVFTIDDLGNRVVSMPACDSFVFRAPDLFAPVILDLAAVPATVGNDGETVTLFVTVAEGGAVDAVTVDLAPLGLAGKSVLHDDGQAPDLVAGDRVWTSSLVLDSTVLGDTYLLTATVTDTAGNGAWSTMRLAVLDRTPSFSSIISFSQTVSTHYRLDGNAISLSAGYGDSLAQTLFQYRAAPVGEWRNCLTVAGTGANPDTEAPQWGILWDIAGLEEGVYDVRVLATTVGGVTDPSPDFVRLVKSASDSVVNGEVDTGTATYLERQVFAPNQTRTMVLYDGTMLDIPADALGTNDSVWVRITVFSGAPPTVALPGFGSGLILPGSGSFRRYEREDGQSCFRRWVKLSIPYDPRALGSLSPSSLAIYHFDPGTRSWIREANCVVDTVHHLVTAQVMHFTEFAIFGAAPAASLENVVVYPNPYIPYDGDDATGLPYLANDNKTGIIFTNLPNAVSIEIFSVAGRKVATMNANATNGNLRWDARTDNGYEVASGMYVAVIKTPDGGKALRKLMIIR